MNDYEAAIALLKILLERSPPVVADQDECYEKIFALFRKCLAEIRGKAE